MFIVILSVEYVLEPSLEVCVALPPSVVPEPPEPPELQPTTPAANTVHISSDNTFFFIFFPPFFEPFTLVSCAFDILSLDLYQNNKNVILLFKFVIL
jgi:hypothetical protein